MFIRSALLLGSCLLMASAANGQSRIGGSIGPSLKIIGDNADAHACYEAARFDMSWAKTLPVCTRALEDGLLNYHDRMATHVNRGILRLRLSDHEGAISDFDSALAISPGQPDALINKGIVLIARGGADDQAYTLINQGLAGKPERPWVGYWARAVVHELAGRDEQAYYDYKRAEELNPGWKPAEEALARFSVLG